MVSEGEDVDEDVDDGEGDGEGGDEIGDGARAGFAYWRKISGRPRQGQRKNWGATSLWSGIERRRQLEQVVSYGPEESL